MNKLLAMALVLMCAAPAAQSQERREPLRRADMTKGILEIPTARIIRESVPQPVAEAAGGLAPVNRTVAPGLVNWHAGYDQAVQAAKASGKPLLVLQMMGRLDQEFC